MSWKDVYGAIPSQKAPSAIRCIKTNQRMHVRSLVLPDVRKHLAP